MAAAWEVKLGEDWKALGDEECAFLQKLIEVGTSEGQLTVRGQVYTFNVEAETQTNVATGRSRPLRRRPVSRDVTSEAPLLKMSSQPLGAINDPESRVVEVWLAGEWKRLDKEEAREIARREAAGEKVFHIEARGASYKVDLESMTQTNLKTGRTRTIRIVNAHAGDVPSGFDEFRKSFRERAPEGGNKPLTLQALKKSFGVDDSMTDLVNATAEEMLRSMDMRGNATVEMTEWIHYWAMERDSPSFHAAKEVNDKLKEAVKQDAQVLGRMQMHFETAVGECGSTSGLPSEGLLRACKRLVDSPKAVLETRWAAEVLEKNLNGEMVVEEDQYLTYYDFLNVMLGRKRFKVSLWKYDISDGVAKNWSWLLLGQNFDGIWHTGVVVDWPDKSSEFWFGGELFESAPGTTPFGKPLEVVPMGYTYKLRPEVWDHCAKQLAFQFTRDTYDVLTHNCNHFSDKLSMFLRNEHIPDDVLYQPDMVMQTVTARALRPLLNRWLGGFGSGKDDRATDGGEAVFRLWETVGVGALIEFYKDEGGKIMIGEITEAFQDDCTVSCLDFWAGGIVEVEVASHLVKQMLKPPPPGAAIGKSQRPPRVETGGVLSYCCPL
eukprot:TRINITY_DN6259_c0_g1_i2.p1 TRINITY_DN6259_c0_g1~~TRINITY_DN6259_c0_g1_i2.p1  ORF type:complete len:606 (+),score=157.40 TRINITY_DN6259_c0_g1_i2:122-1939(+)